MITIIICNLNRVECLRRCISSIRESTHKDYEIIVVDNGSSDGAIEYIECQGDIKLIKNRTNLGAINARNQGLQIARGKDYLFLDNDVILPSNFIEVSKEHMKSNPKIGILGPVSNCVSGEQFDSNFEEKHFNHLPEYSKKTFELNQGNIKLTARLILFCMFVRGEVVSRIGGFDTLFENWGFEDDDYSLRALGEGFELGIAKDLFVYHFGGQGFVVEGKDVGGNSTPEVEYTPLLKLNWLRFCDKWNIPDNSMKRYQPYLVIDNAKNNKMEFFVEIKVNEQVDCNPALKDGIMDKINVGKDHGHRNDSNASKGDKHKVPKCAQLGRLQKLQAMGANAKKNEILSVLRSLVEVRPFHPEAYVQSIDYLLKLKENGLAQLLSNILFQLTPEWDLAENLKNSFAGKKYTSPQIAHFFLNELKSKRNKLSVCLIVKNEEKNIKRCLRSVQQVGEEIIVLDTGSGDNSVEIAKELGAKVYIYKWENDFSKARNKCLEYARGDWVLFLDADEELAPGSEETLKEDMSKLNILGYRLPLKNVGSPLHGCNYVPRLVRNAPGLHFIGKIHETIHASVLVVMRQWNMDQVIGKTKILHHGYKPEELEKKNKIKRNLALYEEALEELPDEASIMMNYAHDLNHDGQNERAYKIYVKILEIFEQHKKESITPEVREQFIHNYGVFLAQHLKMKELSEVMFTRTARETGPVANVHYMAGLGLMNCNKFREAIPELEASMEKAYDDTLAPSVPDIRTWKPKHLLANCHASVGNKLEAIMLWDEVIADCNDSVDTFHDYARFMSTLDRNKEAMEILLKGFKVEGDTQKIWELGCGIVNKDPELAEMSLEWTEEAVKYHPDSDVANVRRGESLMKNGRFAEATDYFSCLSDRGERVATAAQLICRQLSYQGNQQDSEIARGFVYEITGWIDVLDKAPCEFDRELAEQLIG
jgi:glycosyltransferase involved in cell wall biosynthesis